MCPNEEPRSCLLYFFSRRITVDSWLETPCAAPMDRVEVEVLRKIGLISQNVYPSAADPTPSIVRYRKNFPRIPKLDTNALDNFERSFTRRKNL